MNIFKRLQQKPISRILSAAALSTGVLLAHTVHAGSEEQAKRIHDRLTGVPPSSVILEQMVEQLDLGNGVEAARIAIDNDENHDFYNVTLKNWAAPATNRDQTVFVDLNDYIATLIGAVRDGDDPTSPVDFRTAFYGDMLYVGSDASLPAYANNNNAHYAELEAQLGRNSNSGLTLKDQLVRVSQSATTGVPPEGVAGVVTSRAAAKAFLIAGTNRANFRFTLLNHLCLDLEQVHDVTLPPDRIRQDVSRSPGGDARVFLNNCIGCHSGMDPMTQAFAYHNYVFDAENDVTGENGQIEYTPGVVQEKNLVNGATFQWGFVTPNDNWDNYWRQGQNSVLGWEDGLAAERGVGSGTGASSMIRELVHSQQFAHCQVTKAYRAVCLKEPDLSDEPGNDAAAFNSIVSNFTSNGYNMKGVFMEVADYCKGE